MSIIYYTTPNNQAGVYRPTSYMDNTKVQLNRNLLSVLGIELGIVVQSNLHKVTVFDGLNITDQISISCDLNGEMEEIE